MGAVNAQEEDPNDLLGLVLGDRVKIERFVAKGGFGVVYRATHLTLQKPIAVKLLRSLERYDEREKRSIEGRFTQEAELISRLRHPAVVQLLDYGVSALPDGRATPWMALEWLEGVSLAKAVRARVDGPFRPRDALALLRPALEALALAHDQNIAHRDVTPNNLIVVRGPKGPTARLIDFGIARLMEEDAEPSEGNTMTRSGMQMYTRAYVAPEQLSGTRTGPWTDVHGMGLVLTEMLTGQRPYAGTDATERLAKVLSSARPTPGAFGVQVGSWEAVIARALSLRPAERFANARFLLDALEQGLARDEALAPAAPERVSFSTLPPGAVNVVAPAARTNAEAVSAVHTAPERVTSFTSTTEAYAMGRPARVEGAMSSDAMNRRVVLIAAISLLVTFGMWFLLHAPQGGVIPQSNRNEAVPAYNTTVQVPGEGSGAATSSLSLEFPSGEVAPSADAGAPVANAPPTPVEAPAVVAPANDPRFQTLAPAAPAGRRHGASPRRPPAANPPPRTR